MPASWAGLVSESHGISGFVVTMAVQGLGKALGRGGKICTEIV